MLYVTQDLVFSTPVRAVVAPAPAVQAPPSTLPSNRHDMRPAVRVAIETARIEQSLTIDELADLTDIPACTLRQYESGTAFPRARDIATLETHLGKEVLPLK